jgi:hypothetical protein
VLVLWMKNVKKNILWSRSADIFVSIFMGFDTIYFVVGQALTYFSFTLTCYWESNLLCC